MILLFSNKINRKIRYSLLISLLCLLVISFQTTSVSGVVTATTGPYYASDNINNTGWFSPERLYVDGSPAAVADVDGENIVLIDFSIVSLTGVTIDGILVQLNAGAVPGIGTVTISLLYNGRNSTAIESKTTANIPNLYTDYNLGGATDKWGESSWNTDSFTNTNFGIKMEANGPLTASDWLGVQHVKVTVYYTGALPELQNYMLIIIPIILFSYILLNKKLIKNNN